MFMHHEAFHLFLYQHVDCPKDIFDVLNMQKLLVERL